METAGVYELLGQPSYICQSHWLLSIHGTGMVSDTVFLWLQDQKAGLDRHIFVNPIDSSAYMALVW